MRTVLVIWLSYGSLWFYTNGFIPAICILCMYMYVLPNLILLGLHTPWILHGLYTFFTRTIRFTYISGCILAVCCFLMCVLLFYKHVCICQQWRNKDIQQNIIYQSYWYIDDQNLSKLNDDKTECFVITIHSITSHNLHKHRGLSYYTQGRATKESVSLIWLHI